MSADRLVPLASAAATDPAVAGAKAATLARAGRAGLPVLPGYVLPVAAARAALAAVLAAAGGDAGGGAPRRSVFAQPVPMAGALAAAVDRLGGRVIVRSSSPLESDPRWSGAFVSVGEVGPAEVVAAVRSCWASAFAPDPLARAEAAGVAPDRLALAALLQPELTPAGAAGGLGPITAGGTARVAGDRVRVTAVDGHPGALLAGRASGRTTLTAPGGAGLAGAVASLARRAAELLGTDHIEWGAASSELYLLQAGPSRAPIMGFLHDTPCDTPKDSMIDALGGGPALPGRRVRGYQCVAGDAIGRLRFARPHETIPYEVGGWPYILVCERPVPALAPLLFGASGLVSLAGPAECHLVEVARALGVPSLVDAPVDRLTGPPAGINDGGWLAAIEGTRNELVVLPPGAGNPYRTFANVTSALAAGR